MSFRARAIKQIFVLTPLVFFVTSLLFASATLACQCLMMDGAMGEIREAPIIFQGRVVAVQSTEFRNSATIQVSRIWKGEVQPVTTLTASATNSCGRRFSVGEEGPFGAYPGSGDDRGVIWNIPCFYPTNHAIGQALSELGAEQDRLAAPVRRDPSDLAAQRARAALLLDIRDLPRAREAYQSIADLDPDDVESRAAIGRIMLLGGQRQAAVRYLQDLRQRHPASPTVLRFLSQARFATGELTDIASLDFRDGEFSELDLSGRDLRCHDFSGAVLYRVNFTGADLRSTRFRETSFRYVNMTRADLRNSVIEAPRSTRVNFTGADLRHSILRDLRPNVYIAGLGMAPDFADARLDGATIERVNFAWGQVIARASMIGITARDVEFADSMQGVNLTNARLSSVRFAQRASLEGGQFTGATFQQVVFSNPNLQHTNFTGARFLNVRFEGSMRDCSTRFPAGFNPERFGLERPYEPCRRPR